jgi:hypothetical protein
MQHMYTESTESCDSDGRGDLSLDACNENDDDDDKKGTKASSDQCSKANGNDDKNRDPEDGSSHNGHASYNGPEDKALVKYWELDPKSLKRHRCIGRGSCGSVWEGTWLRAKVAIKELDVTVSCAHSRGEVRAMLVGIRCMAEY